LILSKNVFAQSQQLSLEQCRNLALTQNKKLKAAQYDIDAARAAVKTAETNIYPSIDGSATGVYLGKPLSGAMGIIPKNEMLIGSVTATEPIYSGGKIKLGKQAAGKGVEIRQEQKALTESEVLFNVDKAYWQVVQVKEKIVLAETYKEMLTSLQQDLKNSFDAGMIYKNDLLRVEVNLNEAELNSSKAKDGLVLAKLNLAQMIGMAGNIDFSLADSATGNFKELPADSAILIAEQRPEIRLLRKSLEMEELQKKIIKADLKPTIGVSASGLAAGGQHVNISNGKDFLASYYAIASLSFPIFDWGKNASKVKEQTFKIASQQQQLDETIELMNLEVQNAYLQLNQSVKRINLSRLSLEQADENLRLANDRYKAGTVVGKDVLEAQAIWQQAYSNLIDAKVEYKIDDANLRKALGSKN
jgi:outer membrane protein TolC